MLSRGGWLCHPARESFGHTTIEIVTESFLRQTPLDDAACGILAGRGATVVGGTTFSFKASRKTCLTLSTKTNLMSLKGSFGTSSMSRLFCWGRMMVETRA